MRKKGRVMMAVKKFTVEHRDVGYGSRSRNPTSRRVGRGRNKIGVENSKTLAIEMNLPTHGFSNRSRSVGCIYRSAGMKSFIYGKATKCFIKQIT